MELKEIMILMPAFMFAWFGWGFAITYPIRIPVKLIHESGHAFAVWATGGKVHEIRIDRRFGGLTHHEGGNRHLTIHSGFLSSFIFGLLFFYMSTRQASCEHALVMLGLLVILLALLWVHEKVTYVLSIMTGISLMLVGLLLAGMLEVMIVRFFALCLIMYSFMEVFHIREMMRHIKEAATDTTMYLQIARVHTLYWTLLWCALSVIVLFMLVGRAATAMPQ